MRDHIASDVLSFDFNRQGGNIANLGIEDQSGTVINPLHAAPWINGAEELPDHLALAERQLEGDFFCAPFGGNPGLPIHGWTANGDWEPADKDHDSSGGGLQTISYRLKQQVQGAAAVKTFRLRAGHRFLYQSHMLTGGTGHVPVAHHAMIRIIPGARLSFSPKQFGTTPKDPLETERERGFSMLAYPQTFTSPGQVRTVEGHNVDIRTYPFANNHEDIVVLAEAAGSRIGWSAALAIESGFLFFAVKDATTLPETILWMSNGGRKYAPWSGRHTGVLGIEEAATACHDTGEFASAGSPSRHGLVRGVKLEPGRSIEIRYGFGAVRPPGGWTEVADIQVSATTIRLVDISGDALTLPFDGAHFGL